MQKRLRAEGRRAQDIGTAAVREDIAKHLSKGRSVWRARASGKLVEVKPDDPAASTYLVGAGGRKARAAG